MGVSRPAHLPVGLGQAGFVRAGRFVIARAIRLLTWKFTKRTVQRRTLGGHLARRPVLAVAT